jgi:hypothetical protein
VTLVIEIGLAVLLVVSVVARVLTWRGRGGRRRRRPGDGGAGAGDRAGLDPRPPVLSGGAAKRLGETD